MIRYTMFLGHDYQKGDPPFAFIDTWISRLPNWIYPVKFGIGAVLGYLLSLRHGWNPREMVPLFGFLAMCSLYILVMVLRLALYVAIVAAVVWYFWWAGSK